MPTMLSHCQRLARRSTAPCASRTSPAARTAARAPGPRVAAHQLQRAVGNASIARLLNGPLSGRVRPEKTDAIHTSFDDCPANARDVINERTAMAKGWISYSIRQLDAILADPGKPDPDIHALLKKHFHIGEGKRADKALQDVATVRKRFAKIESAFRGDLPFECETSCDKGTTGYVRDYWIFGQGDIHVCPLWFTLDYRRQVKTIMHEMGHKFAGLDDNAYEWQPKYGTLSTSAAMNNADSYAVFARDI
jgi:hypothetical protein